VYAAVVLLLPRPENVTPSGWRVTALFLSTIAGLMIQPMPGAALVIVSLTLFVVVGGLPDARAGRVRVAGGVAGPDGDADVARSARADCRGASPSSSCAWWDGLRSASRTLCRH
jgi:di/tricarboxylate transporter